MHNRLIFVSTLFFCLAQHALNKSVIMGLTIYKSPDEEKTIYLYSDMHIPHKCNQEQIQWAIYIKKALNDKAMFLVEGLTNPYFLQQYKSSDFNLEKELDFFMNQFDFNANDEQESSFFPKTIDNLLTEESIWRDIVNNIICTDDSFLQKTSKAEAFYDCSTDLRGFIISFGMSMFDELINWPLIDKSSNLQPKNISAMIKFYPIAARYLFLPIINSCDFLLEKAQFMIDYQWPEHDELVEKLKFRIRLLYDCLQTLKKALSEQTIFQQRLVENNLLDMTSPMALYLLAKKAMNIQQNPEQILQTYKDNANNILEAIKLNNGLDENTFMNLTYYYYLLGKDSDFLRNVWNSDYFISSNSDDFDLLDIFLFSNIIQSSKNKIIVYAGAIHQRKIGKILEVLDYKTIYNKSSNLFENINSSNDAKEIVLHFVNEKKEAISSADDYLAFIDEISHKITQMISTKNIVTSREEFELPLKI